MLWIILLLKFIFIWKKDDLLTTTMMSSCIRSCSLNCINANGYFSFTNQISRKLKNVFQLNSSETQIKMIKYIMLIDIRLTYTIKHDSNHNILSFIRLLWHYKKCCLKILEHVGIILIRKIDGHNSDSSRSF